MSVIEKTIAFSTGKAFSGRTKTQKRKQKKQKMFTFLVKHVEQNSPQKTDINGSLLSNG